MVKLNIKYKCSYCGKDFGRERTFMVHVCEKKRRHDQRDEKWVQIGFRTYQKFYELQQQQGNKTYDDFAESPYYSAFVKFGRFTRDIKPVHIERWIEWIIKSGVRLDQWCNDKLYDEYLADVLRRESVDDALKRSISTMLEWADNSGAKWQHYFLYVQTTRAVADIRKGAISPWLLYCTKYGKKLMTRLTDEQLEMVKEYVSPNFWASKLVQQKADSIFVGSTMKEAGVE
jgi:hypothetical protein